MAKLHYILVLVSISFFLSCSEKNGLTVDEYIMENGLETTEIGEGVHMIKHVMGGEERPNLDDIVIVDYTGKLTDDSVFEQNEGLDGALRNYIRGWQLGLREIGRGGEITLIIPPSAAYGNSERPGIPRNSTLIFDITLRDF